MLSAISNLREDSRTRSDFAHPLLSRGDIVPTVVRGGEWMLTIADSCELTLDVQYLPAQSTSRIGAGGVLRGREVCGRGRGQRSLACRASAALGVARASCRPKYRATIPSLRPPSRPPPQSADPAVSGRLTLGTTLPSSRGAVERHDLLGPDGINTAHTVNEYVPVGDLTDHAVAVAFVLMRWCGVGGDSLVQGGRVHRGAPCTSAARGCRGRSCHQ